MAHVYLPWSGAPDVNTDKQQVESGEIYVNIEIYDYMHILGDINKIDMHIVGDAHTPHLARN